MEFRRRRLCKTKMRSANRKVNSTEHQLNQSKPNRKWEQKRNSNTSHVTIQHKKISYKANERYLCNANRYKIASNKTETIFYVGCAVWNLILFARALLVRSSAIHYFVCIHRLCRHFLSLSRPRSHTVQNQKLYYLYVNFVICCHFHADKLHNRYGTRRRERISWQTF